MGIRRYSRPVSFHSSAPYYIVRLFFVAGTRCLPARYYSQQHSVRYPEDITCAVTIVTMMMMEDLQYQNWCLGRQLSAMYKALEQVGHKVMHSGSKTRGDDKVHPDAGADATAAADDDDRRQLLDELRRQEVLLRQQIRDLIANLPVRQPQQSDEVTKTNTILSWWSMNLAPVNIRANHSILLCIN